MAATPERHTVVQLGFSDNCSLNHTSKSNRAKQAKGGHRRSAAQLSLSVACANLLPTVNQFSLTPAAARLLIKSSSPSGPSFPFRASLVFFSSPLPLSQVPPAAPAPRALADTVSSSTRRKERFPLPVSPDPLPRCSFARRFHFRFHSI